MPTTSDGTHAPAGGGQRQATPPDNWQLDPLRWALFNASFVRAAPNGGLHRLLMRSGHAMRDADLSPPVPLAPHHDFEEFDCGVARLNELLRNKGNAMSSRSPSSSANPDSQTFVIAAGRKVAGFYTERRGSIVPPADIAGDAIRLTVVPHFAIDRRWRDGRIFADMLMHLVRNAFSAMSATGSQGLYGYAIDRKVKRLYVRMGARPVPALVHPLATMITFADVERVLGNPAESDNAGAGNLDSAHEFVMRGRSAVEAEASDRMVTCNIQRGICYEFNHVTARVWSLLVEPMRVADLCERLMLEFDVDRQTCRSQVSDLLAELGGKGLIEFLPRQAAIPHEAP